MSTAGESEDGDEWITPRKVARTSTFAGTSKASPKSPSVRDGRYYKELNDLYHIQNALNPAKLPRATKRKNEHVHNGDEGDKKIYKKKTKKQKNMSPKRVRHQCTTCGKICHTEEEIEAHVLKSHLKFMMRTVIVSEDGNDSSNSRDDKLQSISSSSDEKLSINSDEEMSMSSEEEETDSKTEERQVEIATKKSDQKLMAVDTKVNSATVSDVQTGKGVVVISSDESDSELPVVDIHSATVPDFKATDDACPLYSVAPEPYDMAQLVKILHHNDKLCQIAPVPVFQDGKPQNCCYKVSSKVAKKEILSSNNCGAWTSSGSPVKYFVYKDNKEVRKVTMTSAGKAVVKIHVGNKWKEQNVSINEVYTFKRFYSYANNNPNYKRMFVSISKHADLSSEFPSFVHYYWGKADVQNEKFILKPHGNAKQAKPYTQTKPSVLSGVKAKLTTTSTPAQVYQETFDNAGGINCTDFSNVPRNKGQVYNANRKNQTKKDMLADVIEQQQKEEPENKFVRKVFLDKSGPACVNYTDQQIADIAKFCKTSVLSVDTTYNLGNFYITNTAYKHHGLINPRTGQHPVFAGPSMVHYSNTTAVFKQFAAELVSANPDIRNIHFGSDEDAAIYNGFEAGLASGASRKGKHLLCFNHVKDSIKRKLRDLNFPAHAVTEIQNDIFGYVDGEVKHTGIIDAKTTHEFEMLVLNCQEKWDELERACTKNEPPRFCTYFIQHKAQLLVHKMIAPVRQSAGLGNPPQPYTQNDVESINHLCKKTAQFQKKDWASVNNDLRNITQTQRTEGVKALFGSGTYILSPEFAELAVEPNKWRTSTTKKRLEHARKFNHYQVKPNDQVQSYQSAIPDTSATTTSQTTQKEADVHFQVDRIPGTAAFKQETWTKANQLLQIKGAIVNAPGGGNIVLTNHLPETATTSTSSSKGGRNHVFVRSEKQWSCECVTFQGRRVCFHLIAVALFENRLNDCLDYVGRQKPTNLMSLYREQIPKSAGRKPQQQKRAKKAQVVVTKEIPRISGQFTKYYHNNLPWFVCSVNEVKDPKKFCPSCEIHFPINPSVVCRPFDIVLKHEERYSYKDKKTGQWIPTKYYTRNVFYCCSMKCVLERHPYFSPTMLKLEESLDLHESHQRALLEEFGVEF